MKSVSQLAELPEFPSVDTLAKRYKRAFPGRQFDRHRVLSTDELAAILSPDMKDGQPQSDIVRELSAQMDGHTDKTTDNDTDVQTDNPTRKQTTTRTRRQTNQLQYGQQHGHADRQLDTQTDNNTDTQTSSRKETFWTRIFGRGDEIGRLDVVNYAEMAFQAQNLTVLMGGFGAALSVMTIMVTLELQHIVKDIRKDKASQYGQWIFALVSALISWLIHYPAIKSYLHGHEEFLPVDVRIVAGVFSGIAWLLSVSAILIVRMKLQDDDWYKTYNPQS